MSFHYYCDPFNVQEEEEYLEMERKESHQQIQKWIQALVLSFTCHPPAPSSVVNHIDDARQDDSVKDMTHSVVSPVVLPTLWTNHFHHNYHHCFHNNNIINNNNNIIVMEIQLNLPLELQSLQDLVHAMMMQQPQPPSSSLLSSSTTMRRKSRLFRLKLSHWGLPADQGIATLVPLLPQIVELSLTHCGITAQGFYQLLLALQPQLSTSTTTNNSNAEDDKEDQDHDPCQNNNNNSNNLYALDLSHNPLLRIEGNPKSRMMTSWQSPKELLQYLFLHVLPSCTIHHDSLKHLNLSSTGLYFSEDLWDALWQGVQQSQLCSLDISNNHGHDSDPTLLIQSVLPYLSTLPLQSLILTKSQPLCTVVTTTGPNDSTTTGNNLLDQVQNQLQTNHRLMYLGPFSMGTKNSIHDYILRRNRIRHWYLHNSTTTATTTTTKSRTTATISKKNGSNTNTNHTSESPPPPTTTTSSGSNPSSNMECGAMSLLLEKLVAIPVHSRSYSLVYWIFQETNILQERSYLSTTQQMSVRP